MRDKDECKGLEIEGTQDHIDTHDWTHMARNSIISCLTEIKRAYLAFIYGNLANCKTSTSDKNSKIH